MVMNAVFEVMWLLLTRVVLQGRSPDFPPALAGSRRAFTETLWSAGVCAVQAVIYGVGSLFE